MYFILLRSLVRLNVKYPVIIYLVVLILNLWGSGVDDVEAQPTKCRTLSWIPSAVKSYRASFQDYQTDSHEKDDYIDQPPKAAQVGPLCSEYKIEHLNVLDRSYPQNSSRSLESVPTVEHGISVSEDHTLAEMHSILPPVTFPPQTQSKEVLRPSYESAVLSSNGHAEASSSNRPSTSREHITRSAFSGHPRVRPAGPRARTSSGAS